MPEVMVQEVIFDSEDDGLMFPHKLVDAIEWLQGCLDEVPEEFRKEVVLETSSVAGEDSHWPTLKMYYLRPETAEERAERIRGDARRASERAKTERALYERLKAIYGP